MPVRKSSGILLYRFEEGTLQVLLVHHGGPFWKGKDAGAWSIPKGEFREPEQPLEAAIREFKEETGYLLEGQFIELNPVTQKAGKLVYAWALEGNIDVDTIQCNTFKIQWPPKSGKWQEYPEIDKGEWFILEAARVKINPAQTALLDELVQKLKR